MRIDIVLRGEDAEWFQELKEEEAEKRRGNEPTRAEMQRLLMRQFDESSKSRR